MLFTQATNKPLSIFILFFAFITGVEATPPVSIKAERIVDPVTVDGQLNENSWHRTGYSQFWQREPEEGKPASERTEVWLAYDNDAIYLAARLYDSQPESISSLLGRRDDSLDCDWFWLYLDPFHDKRSGFAFGITPAGSVSDCVYYNDSFSDNSWDAVWSSATSRDDLGWTVEMRIPFNQLRFNHHQEEYVWGVHFRRVLMRRNETVESVFIPRTAGGFVSHFLDMNGIEGINPKSLFNIIPYTVGKGTLQPDEKDQASGSFGIDAKIGLLSNLTLDLSFNPDFGQVEVDPASINLSAAETYYSEKRSFFIEGSDIFTNFGYEGATNHIGANWSSPDLFYSRRIGRPPQGSGNGEVIDSSPEWSTILGAAKLTGTVGEGWKIGAIYALTDREFAGTIRGNGNGEVELEPLTHYSVVRTLKEFNNGRQGVGFLGTLVLRDFNDPSLQKELSRSSWASGLDWWSFLDKKKVWALSGWLAASRVNGSREQILTLQQEYPHYYQRPDADHVELDPTATSLDGWSGRVELSKEQGNFRLHAALGAVSPGFDVQDAGYLGRSDIINGHVMIGWRDYTPGKLLRNWSISLFTQRNYNFDGIKIGEQRLIAIANIRFLNYWSVYFQTSQNAEQYSHTATRGGPLMKVPAYQWYDFGISSDSRKKIVYELDSFYNHSRDGSDEYSVSLGISWKPNTCISLSLTPAYTKNLERTQWVTRIRDEQMTATYGNRYIFSTLDMKEISCSLRMNWIFSPRLSIQAYIQPFISVGRYSDFAELSAPSTNQLRVYGQNDSTIRYSDGVYTIDPDALGTAGSFTVRNPDFNMKSLRGTVVLRWEYRPGSSFYFVWTQNRADYSNPGDLRFGRDIGNLFSAQGSNVFMIKLSHSFNL